MLVLRKYNATFAPAKTRKGARVVEEARLESVLAAKPPQGFESPSFRNNRRFSRFFGFVSLLQLNLICCVLPPIPCKFRASPCWSSPNHLFIYHLAEFSHTLM